MEAHQIPDYHRPPRNLL